MFRPEAVLFRRYVLALLSVGLLRKFEAYLVYLSLIRSYFPRCFSFFQKILILLICYYGFALSSPVFPRKLMTYAVVFQLCRAQYKGSHSRPQRPRSFWSAPRIATSGLVQRHSVFEWLCKHNRLKPEPIRFVGPDSEHAQSDGKSVNHGLPVLDLARGRDSWC